MWKHGNYILRYGHGHESINDTNLLDVWSFPTLPTCTHSAKQKMDVWAHPGLDHWHSSVTEGVKGSELRKFANEGLRWWAVASK